MSVQIQIRRDTAANWTNIDPLLAQGEIGYELDSGLLKIGNGEDPWSSLEYYLTDVDGVNLGSGEGLYTSSSGIYMLFKSIVAGDNISLISDGETITISGTTDLYDKVLYQDGSAPLSADWDAGAYRIASGGFDVANAELELSSYANITGLLTGGGLSVNSEDNTLLDVASGTSIYVDMSDRSLPIVEEISWPSQTLDPTLSGVRSKWAGVQRTAPGVGSIIFDTDFTQIEKRSTTILGRFWGSGGAEISKAKNYAVGAFSFGKSMEDIVYALGSINIFGNVFSASTTPMKLDRSAGESFRFAANYGSEPLSPNITTSNAAIPQGTYQYHLQGQNTTESSATIEPDYYDLAGVKTAVPTGKWTVQRVFYFPVSHTVHIAYGQDYHDSKTLAIDHIPDDNPVINTDILEGSIFRAYLVVQQGATDLTDEDQAKIIQAYGQEGLFTGVTNHGELGGLEDDDHPQYHNDTRGDARYYTQTQVDTLSGTLSQAENINYINTAWEITNVSDALEKLTDYMEYTHGSGRISPETVLTISGTTSILDISSGEGYINYEGIHKELSWIDDIIDFASMDQGIHYVYIDVNGDLLTSMTYPGRSQVILLGFVYFTGLNIGLVQNCGCVIKNAINRIVDFTFNLGTFLSSNNGSIQMMSGESKKIISPACSAQYGLSTINLSEISSDDATPTGNFYCVYTSIDEELEPLGYFSSPVGYAGEIPTDRWNDVTASGNVVLNGTYTFTQYSNIVTTSVAPTDLGVDDFIYLYSDGYLYSTPVATISGTTVVLESIYSGTGGAGTAIASKALPRIPNGKWAKHLIGRTLDNALVFIFSQTYFDTEDEANNAGGPTVPSVLEQSNIKMAYITCSGSATDISSGIKDIRPLPFFAREGGSQGVGVITDHGELSGLSDDDHMQYILTDGSRTFTSKAGYASHPIFSIDTDIIDKKYVDDKQFDHGGLAGLSDDDHTQYHNNTRGDARYYTKTELDAGQLDTRYYTETEVDNHNWTESDITDLDKYTQEEVDTISGSIVNQIITDHGSLSGLSDDDHTQYLNTARGDARYYTESEIDTKLSQTTPLTIKDEGTNVTNTPHTALNFVGTGVAVSDAGGGTATVNISSGGSTITVQDEGVSLSGTPHSVLNFTGGQVTASDAGGGVANIDVPYPIFGTWYGWGGDLDQTSTNCTYWVRKSRVDIPSVPAAYYRIGWYFEWRMTTVSYDFRAQVQIDNTETIMSMNEESKDTHSWHPANGFGIVYLTAGTHFIDTDFSVENYGYTAYMRNLRIEYWRVSD